MLTDLDRLTQKFCRTLHGYSGGVSMSWRSIIMVGSIAGIRAASTQKMVVAHGVKKGWLIESGRTVALTDEGQSLGVGVEPGGLFRPAVSHKPHPP